MASKQTRTRGYVRAQLSRLRADVEAADKDNDLQAAERLIEQLKQKERKLEQLNEQVISTLSEEGLEKEMEEIEKYEKLIADWTSRMRRIVTNQEKTSLSGSIAESINASLNTSNVSSVQRRQPEQLMKLPKLELKKYNGDLLGWCEFWKTFSATIHDKDHIHPLDKFNYLRNCLIGPALRAIEGLRVTEANYIVAIAKLKKQFEREDLIIDMTMTSFAELPSPQNNAVSLRSFLDDIQNKIYNLKNLNVEVNACSGTIRPLIVRALPFELRKSWIRKSSTDKLVTLDELLSFLEDEIDLLEKSEVGSRVGKEKTTFQPDKIPKSNRAMPSTAALNVVIGQTQTNAPIRPRSCQICDSLEHLATNCTVKTLGEKLALLKSKRRCFNCLWVGHIAKACPKEKAKCKICKGFHQTVLCSRSERAAEEKGEEEKQEVSRKEAAVDVAVGHVSNRLSKEVVYLKSAVVIVDGPKDQVKARLVLDGGSQRSFISKRLADKIGAEVVGSELTNVDVFEHDSQHAKVYPRVRVRLFDSDGNNSVCVVLNRTEAPCSRYSLIPTERILQELDRRGLRPADPGDRVKCAFNGIDILIGGDVLWAIVSGTIERLSDRLVAMESVFGWFISGVEEALTHEQVPNQVTALHVTINKDNLEATLFKEVEKLWNVEGMGISGEAKNEQLDPVERLVSDSMKKLPDRYCVQLPWNDRKEELLPNRSEAMRRFAALTKRLNDDPVMLCRYHEAIKDYVNEGHAEIVLDPCEGGPPLYYIPHRAVLREERDTTKLRVVFDASSGQPSLNDCLHQGPHLNPDVMDVLLRFREHNIALIADIAKAFLQVELDPADRDAVRFFWLPLDWRPGDQVRPVTYRMKRVLFGLNCGPFLLAATIRHHLRTVAGVDPDILELLGKNLYVDDLVASVSSVKDGLRLYYESSETLRQAGFKLRKWKTNSPELQETIDEYEGAERDLDSNHTKSGETKVLGLLWDSGADELKFDTAGLSEFAERNPPTKRTVLRVMARVFDPLGFLSPTTVRLKFIFQDLWKEGIPWDEVFEGKRLEQWEGLREDLLAFMNIRVPRCLSSCEEGGTSSRHLHVFSDASEKAYGAAVYLVEFDGKIRSSRLVVSKNKVAPTKEVTIPRLELLGALVGARLVNTVKQTIGLPEIEVHCWTDSMVALGWIRGDPSRWKVFVANRVKEICELTDKTSWNHVRSSDNPADKITRGLSAEELKMSRVWWEGPPWLLTNEDPAIVDEEMPVEEILQETKGDRAVLLCVEGPTPPWDSTRYGRWSRLVRVVAWIRRFVTKCRRLTEEAGELSVDELSEAERVILRQEQRYVFAREYTALSENKAIDKRSKLYRFDPKIDDNGLIRLGGRLHFSMIDHDTRHPIPLDGESWLTRLIIDDCHRTVLHGGVSETMVELREKFWVPCARNRIKKILKKCVVCTKRSAKPATAIEAPLPPDRVNEASPFEIVGLDFAGPLLVRQDKNNQIKTYILLITCAVTRAIHLELVKSMSADDFLLALRRFFARRGVCRVIWSDNAKTFKRAAKDLSIWDTMNEGGELSSFLRERRVNWNFIVDRAPWWGGMWERMVKSVKEKLKTVCGHASLDYEEMRTVLVEIEGVINSRPLCYVSDEPKEVLTPAHFLVGRRLTAPVPTSKMTTSLCGSAELGRRWKYRLDVMNRFWKSWRNDYILQLRSAHQRNRSNVDSGPLEPGQLILLADDKTPRHLWRVCIVDEIIKGRDGQVRSSFVRTPQGTRLKRPVQLLCPIEVGA